MFLDNLQTLKPKQLRTMIAKEEFTRQTSGLARGYAQANLIILPQEYAREFEEFAKLNPKPCPILEICKTPYTQNIAEHANILTEIPKYYIYRYGKKCDEVLNAQSYYEELGKDCVAFLIGCSFSFEEALLESGLEVRHITQSCNVPMYKTSIPCKGYGRMQGNLVVSMRPFKPKDIDEVYMITKQFPKVHGKPIFHGDPQKIGIKDINKPDYGDSVTIHEGEIPVFWACGVTPQNIIMQAKPPLAITHAPGHMFIADLLNADLKGL